MRRAGGTGSPDRRASAAREGRSAPVKAGALRRSCCGRTTRRLAPIKNSSVALGAGDRAVGHTEDVPAGLPGEP